MGSLFIGVWTAFTFTDKYLPLLLFTLFAILGGFSLGALNSRKARQQAKYKNEYTTYAGLFIAAIIFLGIYYLFWAIDKIIVKEGIDLSSEQVIYISMGGGFIGLMGIGLSVANALAE
ncbi:MAG: hypothetical protein INQ03_01635 [Candidatus Heimdallarchaeota archaeon]|nr:hypothetical protein [Candidatus Heimdallarchaeota archaeon]